LLDCGGATVGSRRKRKPEVKPSVDAGRQASKLHASPDERGLLRRFVLMLGYRGDASIATGLIASAACEHCSVNVSSAAIDVSWPLLLNLDRIPVIC
jgi:hypothetical protein